LSISIANVVRIQSARHKVVFSGLGQLWENRCFQKKIDWRKFVELPREGAKRATRLRPQEVGIGYIIRIRPPVGSSAVSTSEQFENAGAAVTMVAWLAVEFSSSSVLLLARQF
jgi:hypothetical protein